jgi:hypothetical protein
MMFNLAYGLKWGYDEMHEMPMGDLLMFHQMLIEQWDREHPPKTGGQV